MQKRWVLRRRKLTAAVTSWGKRHVPNPMAAATENVRSPTLHGTRVGRWEADERIHCMPARDQVDWRGSLIGAVPCRQRCARRVSLNVILSGARTQWIRPTSDNSWCERGTFGSATVIAAVFITDWNQRRRSYNHKPPASKYDFYLLESDCCSTEFSVLTFMKKVKLHRPIELRSSHRSITRICCRTNGFFYSMSTPLLM